MRDDKKALRQSQIEAAAYEVLEAKGYEGTSMLGIARQARASNETLYNWYGDKQGLFRALVARNAKEVKDHLSSELKAESDPLSILETLGPKLLALLTGDRAIAINRAAAADGSGELGKTLSQAGRDTIYPLLTQVLLNARAQGHFSFEDAQTAVGLYLDLLVGDQQIRRVIGRLPRPSASFCEERSQRAIDCLKQILGERR